MRPQVVGKGAYRRCILAVSHEQHPRMVKIDEQRHVVVAAPRGGLVEGDAANRAMIGAPARACST